MKFKDSIESNEFQSRLSHNSDLDSEPEPEPELTLAMNSDFNA